jgi:hypothetical protein
MAETNRIERILAQILVITMKDASLGDKAVSLSRAGFDPSEIAALIGASPGSVRQQLYTQRKSGKKKLKKV